MANPQKEDGYTPIAHTILEALATHVISPDEWRVLMVILRKTFGWDKKQDRISHTQFSKITNIPRNHIPRIINKLIARNIIYKDVPQPGDHVPQSGYINTANYGFQKDFDKWCRRPPNRGLSPKQDKGVPQSGPKVSPNRGHTKDIKETIQKKTTDTRPFLNFYTEKFKEHFGTEPLIDWGKDGAIIKNLLKIVPFDQLKKLLEDFFYSEDKFITGSGYTIGVFKTQINKLKIGESHRDGMDLWLQVKEEQDARDRPKEVLAFNEKASSDISDES